MTRGNAASDGPVGDLLAILRQAPRPGAPARRAPRSRLVMRLGRTGLTVGHQRMGGTPRLLAV